jgi:hypothetical protein
MRDDGLEIIRRCEGEKVHTQVQFFFFSVCKGPGLSERRLLRHRRWELIRVNIVSSQDRLSHTITPRR